MSIVLYILLGIIILILAVAGWVKVSIWKMGLGVDDDGRTNWPWKE